ncbi:MAG: cell division protein FtsI [Lachnospiraceae bacterium]|nr:cell division protein FtsI [Lachnospiraceae bacterium]
MDKKKAFEKYTDIGPDSDLSEEEIEDRSNIVGIWFEEEYKRNYPMGSLACDTIGFMFDDGNADWGLEGYYDSVLKGVDGRQYGYFSSDSTVEQNIIQPTDGKTIKTTIDAGIQRIVEKYIQAFIHAMGSEELGVIVMDPDNGEVLAMGTRDFYDLNNPRDLTGRYTSQEIEQMSDEQTVEALNNMWRNYCVTDSYEPGSTVKPLVVAAAMEDGIIQKDAKFLCDGGWSYGEGDDEYIRCTSVHGEQTLAQVIANSCNDAMMQIGAMMGTEKFLDSQSAMNFGMKTGIDLPGEGAGVLHTKDSLGSVELATDSFGQGFMLTMVQEAAAISSVINGGYYYQPHLVSKVLDSQGKVVKNITPTLMRQTVSTDISASVREQMRATVEGGTGKYSKVQGYSSGGKTGTAEKFPRNEEKYLVSFIGFAPVADPELVVYVVIDEAHTENQESSKLSQYIAQGILAETLPYLNVEPDESEDGTIPPTTLWSGFAGYLQQTGQENSGLGNTQIRKSENQGSQDPAEVVTGENLPQPPDMNQEVDLNNNVESDGITNEDAGF